MPNRLPSLAILITAVALTFGGIPASRAQVPAGGFDAATRATVIDAVATAMNERYVFAPVGRDVEAALRDPARRAPLLDSASPQDFATRLTTVLQQLTRDKHLRVTHSETVLPEQGANHRPSPAQLEQWRASEVRRNFGVERVERLPGNIGYIDLRGFAAAQWAGEAIAAAMTLVAHTDALIVDLRRNGGGDPATVALMTSYLLDERTHLNDLYYRPGDRRSQYWSHAWVPGPRFGGTKPVHVLTSSNTFSGAEEFSHNLKHLKRATLVGETTGGGAHPGEFRRLTAHFSMFLPTGRAINPVSGGNWEGTGVAPDIAVKADDALRVAQLRLLPPLVERADKAGEARLRDALKARIADLEKTS